MKTGMDDSIVTLVDYAMGEHCDGNLLFHVCVDARMDLYAREEDGDDAEDIMTHRDIHFLFHRPTSYTKVFVAVEGFDYLIVDDGRKYPRRQWVRSDNDDRVFGSIPESLNSLAWRMHSDHDSCWRSDGVGSVLHEIEMSMRKDFGDRFDLGRVSPYHSFSIFCKPKMVEADVVVDEEANADRHDTYMKKPVNIRKACVVNNYCP